jgi:gamma-glutamyltranspeptidase/glutathione hydrolase
VHAVAESLKRAYADYHAYVADPAFVAVPLDRLLSPAYAKRRAKEVDRTRMTTKVVAGDDPREGPSTTSLVVADRHGNLVSLTQTISDFFGAKVMVEGTGIILNNEMKNFSARGVNAMAPGKRMRTLIAPTVLLRGKKPLAVLGTPGGPRITSTTVLLVSNLVDHGMSVQEAIEAPRYFARDTEKDLTVESRVPPGALEALGGFGYTVQEMKDYDLFFGGAQAIVIDRRTGNRVGGADPRRDGTVSGY